MLTGPDARDPGPGAGGDRASHPRTIVKVCGVTRLADARFAVESGADWIGVILHGDSPRRVSPERAAKIAAAIPGVPVVAVMVGVTPDHALEIARRAGALRVQIHRPAAPWPAEFPLPAAIVVPVDRQGRLAADPPAAGHLLMLDTADPERAGGTGRRFPWYAAVAIARERLVMIAGGLTPANVAEAVRRVRPFAVDASSGLERAPGIKDSDLVRRFVLAVRELDAAPREPAA